MAENIRKQTWNFLTSPPSISLFLLLSHSLLFSLNSGLSLLNKTWLHSAVGLQVIVLLCQPPTCWDWSANHPVWFSVNFIFKCSLVNSPHPWNLCTWVGFAKWMEGTSGHAGEAQAGAATFPGRKSASRWEAGSALSSGVQASWTLSMACRKMLGIDVSVLTLEQNAISAHSPKGMKPVSKI